jgi:soluble lytic murein transglycosylase-like protein
MKARLVYLLTRDGAALSRLQHPAARAAFACLVIAMLTAYGYRHHTATQPLVETTQAISATSLYSQIFMLQQRGHFDAADTLLSQLMDDTLLGYVLAQRYQNPDYHASTTELTTWLANYSDHPQAAEILQLAKASGASTESLPAIKQPLQGAGSVDHLGRSTMPDRWYQALRLWKEQKYSKAAPIFTTIRNDTSLNAWQRSAGAYWAYRSFTKLEQSRAANRALANAAQFPHTFYGMLAATQQGASVKLSGALPSIPYSLWNNAAVIRARMLTAIDHSDEAETELRQLYSALATSDRRALISVAAQLHLPNLQLRIAQLEMDGDDALVASYPMPQRMLTAQNTVNPALLLAVARQESGFRETVRSESGAVGMMQMLPSTAQHVLQQSKDISLTLADNGNDGVASLHDRLNDQVMSTKMGAGYFSMLKRNPAVGNNLMRMLAAYNAGPGTVSMWQSAAKQINDPLLYMESIPYPETRNYVSQVMTNYWIYQSMLGEQPRSLKQLARGQWPTV